MSVPKSSHRCLKHRNKKTLVLVVIWFNITMICLIIILALTNMSNIRTKKTAMACVLCQTQKPRLQDNSLSKHSDNEARKFDVCCVKNVDQMKALLDRVMKSEPHPLEPLKRHDQNNFTLSLVSSHKHLKYSEFYMRRSETTPDFSPGNEADLLFDSDSDNAMLDHARGIDILPSAYRVSHTGLYYVYSSVHFKPHSSRKCAEFDKKTWHHKISLSRSQSTSDSGTLLSSVHTCADEIKWNSETTYTGGVFELEKDDFLRVEVSGYGIVSFTPQATYFGLMMISN